MERDAKNRLRELLDKLPASRRELFEKAFNQEMSGQGDARTLEDFLGASAAQPGGPTPRALASITFLLEETTDATASAVMERAVAVYRSIVQHAREGGTVSFVSSTAPPKTLKVRLRERS